MFAAISCKSPLPLSARVWRCRPRRLRIPVLPWANRSSIDSSFLIGLTARWPHREGDRKRSRTHGGGAAPSAAV